MNKIISIISLLSAVLLVSCGEDRTYEYEEQTAHNIWMYEQMKDKYLWADKLPEQTWKNYFSTPYAYFASLIKYGTNDYASHIEVVAYKDSIDNFQRGYFMHNKSYGFDFKIVPDPTNETSDTYARVITVYSNSPADSAGLKRNDYIQTFNNSAKPTTKNTGKLQRGDSLTLVVKTLTINSDSTAYILTDPRTLKVNPSCYVEDVAFPVSEIIQVDNDRVGYLMCNRLTETNVEKETGTKYKDRMDTIMKGFKSQNVNQLVLDLRLCNDGTMEMARRLASYIIPYSSGNIFARTVWNSKYTGNNETIYFDSSLSGETLGLQKLVVITSSYTQGAAEWLIRALQNVLGTNVIVIGSSTKGQYCMPQSVEGDEYKSKYTMYPAVAYVLFGSETEVSTKSIEPTHSIDEFDSIHLYEYGDTRETMLSSALTYLYTTTTDSITSESDK